MWRITYLTHNPKSSPHFVILLCDKSHICTCLMILNRGLVCRHFFQVMIRSKQAQFSISLIKKRWLKLEVNESQLSNPKTHNNLDEYVDVNGQSSCIKESTVLDELRDDSYFINDINVKINARHLYSNLFGLGRKIAQIATEKHRSDVLDVFNQILEELYDDDDTSEVANESNRILNPHIVKSKGRPRNKRYKSSVETNKDSSKSGGSNTFIQDDGQGSSQGNKCSNCNETSHNIRRCTAPCKTCKKEGHTYVKCKGKGKDVENHD